MLECKVIEEEEKELNFTPGDRSLHSRGDIDGRRLKTENPAHYIISTTFSYSVFISVTFQILRFLARRLVFLDLKDVMCAAILLYHFRIFDRRYGSRKFSVR